ncbi:MAG: AAA family ATPase [Archaeoglobi archaeon]|nr:AAA family ATPase [Candidatus Mnemosynella bozhongmuii]
MDKEALERILKNEKEKHQDEWREIKNAVFENLEKLREFAKKDNISEEDVRLIDGEFMGKLRSLTGEHILWIWGSVKTNEKIIAEFLNRESFRSIRLEAEKIRDVNEIERIREPLERVTKERNTKLSTVSSWLCVMNPFVFIPAYRGIFSKPLLKELGLKRFFGDDTDIDKYITLLKALSEINKKLQIESMIEAAFYLSKFKNPTASSQVNTYMENLRATQEPKSPKIDEITRQKIEYLLKHKKQVILYGPPGTGKTWIATNLVRELINEKTTKQLKTFEFVTFHPSYSYEEFVEGIRPVTDEEGRITYKIEDGIFKRFCRDAYNALLDYAGVEKRWKVDSGLPELDEEEKELVREALNGDFPEFYLIIDEINRGDISKIFGELITLLEADKRLFAENEITVTLPYSKERFGVPPNLYIIGTMNTADRSIALIDVALRRRFGFIELMPDYGILEKMLLEVNVSEEVKEIRKLAINALRALNERIKRVYDRDHQIGHSYLLKLKDAVDRDSTITTLKFIWYHEILPLLQEYFYDSPDRIADVLNGRFVQVRDNYIEFKEVEGNNFLAELEGVAESKD